DPDGHRSDPDRRPAGRSSTRPQGEGCPQSAPASARTARLVDLSHACDERHVSRSRGPVVIPVTEPTLPDTRRCEMAQKSTGYGRRSWKTWLAIYLVIGAIAYAVIYLLFFTGGGSGRVGY